MFTSLRTRTRRTLLLGCVSGAALLVLAVGQASAAVYPNGGSSFTGSAEGWKVASAECKVSGFLEVLCGTEGTGYDGTAGAPAGSFADKAQIPLNAVGVFKAAFVDESPAFTAAAGGAGSLSLSREFVPSGLLPLTPTATYSAFLVDQSTGTRQKAVAEALNAESAFATRSGGVSLTAGDTYAVQIEASTSTELLALGLLGETTVRFDNVAVSGPDRQGGNPGGENPSVSGAGGGNGGNGGEGSGGKNGKGGAGGLSTARMENLLRTSLVGPAVLKGNRLTVKAKCPAKLRATCTLVLKGMLNKHKAATKARRARIKKNRKKNFALKVRPAARKKVRARKKLLFKETARVGKSRVTVYRTLRLVRKKG